MPWSRLGFKQPTGTLSALPIPYDIDKTSKGKISSKVSLLMMYLLQKKDKGNPQENTVFKPKKAVLTTVFWGLFCFEVHSHQNMYFLDYSHSLWLSHHNWEFQHKLGITQSTSVQEGKLVLRKGLTKKGNEIMYSEPGSSCPKSVSELLKNWHRFKISPKPRQQFCNI